MGFKWMPSLWSPRACPHGCMTTEPTEDDGELPLWHGLFNSPVYQTQSFCVHGSVALDFPVALGDVSATSEDVWRSGTEGREVNHEEES